MRVAYLDCFAGISGDMFLGALIDAGVPTDILREAAAGLALGASLTVDIRDRSGISCTSVKVHEDDRIAKEETPEESPHQRMEDEINLQPQIQHWRESGHPHHHAHWSSLRDEPDDSDQPFNHGRSLTEIRASIQRTSLADSVKKRAIKGFDLLGASEARIHNVGVDEIHFHEVGAVDAMVDIVAASAGIEYLSVDEWHCSPVNVGGGMVRCAHGLFPVPAPATADLLRNYPTYSAHIQQELTTPTGAAILRMLAPTFGQQPLMRVEQVGYGAGTRNPKDFPNVLRLSVGERLDHATFSKPADPMRANKDSADEHVSQTVTVLESALDDLSPQVLGHFVEIGLAAGALDVMLTPVIMKKGRPGTLLTVLCKLSDSAALQQLVLRETGTLGLRIRQEDRVCLARRHTTVQTVFGPIRIKVGSLLGEEYNAAPEYEDCRAAAAKYCTPLKQIQLAAITAYRETMIGIEI